MPKINLVTLDELEEIGMFLSQLANRPGFSLTIGHGEKKQGGTYSVELAYFSDGGSNYEGGFKTLIEALRWAAREQDEEDDRRIRGG